MEHIFFCGSLWSPPECSITWLLIPLMDYISHNPIPGADYSHTWSDYLSHSHTHSLWSLVFWTILNVLPVYCFLSIWLWTLFWPVVACHCYCALFTWIFSEPFAVCPDNLWLLWLCLCIALYISFSGDWPLFVPCALLLIKPHMDPNPTDSALHQLAKVPFKLTVSILTHMDVSGLTPRYPVTLELHLCLILLMGCI